jgi:hypothetical protein
VSAVAHPGGLVAESDVGMMVFLVGDPGHCVYKACV